MRIITFVITAALLFVSYSVANARWRDYWDVYPNYSGGCHKVYRQEQCRPPEDTVTCNYFDLTDGCCCEGLLWVPDRPSNVKARAEGNTIYLDWDPQTAEQGEIKYQLYWSKSAVIELNEEHRFILTENSFTHSNLEFNQKYYYSLRAVNRYGGSKTWFNVTTDAPEPDPDTPAPGGEGALYRYFNRDTGDHFYTTNWSELDDGRKGYTYEGITGYVLISKRGNMVPLYRYYMRDTGDHFYTTNWNELGNGRSGYVYEGIQGYVFSSQQANTLPLYRYYMRDTGDHFYTTNWNELGNGRSGYVLEGIQCYISVVPI